MCHACMKKKETTSRYPSIFAAHVTLEMESGLARQIRITDGEAKETPAHGVRCPALAAECLRLRNTATGKITRTLIFFKKPRNIKRVPAYIKQHGDGELESRGKTVQTDKGTTMPTTKPITHN
jgi:hypothetical protein